MLYEFIHSNSCGKTDFFYQGLVPPARSLVEVRDIPGGADVCLDGVAVLG